MPGSPSIATQRRASAVERVERRVELRELALAPDGRRVAGVDGHRAMRAYSVRARFRESPR